MNNMNVVGSPSSMMKFAPSGTYVMAKYTNSTCEMLHGWAEHHNIPKPLHQDKLHSTIIQSSKTIPDYHELNQEADGIKVTVKSLAIFPTRFKSISGKPEGALVLILDAPILEDLHWELIHTGRADHFRPDYTPHLTLTYYFPIENANLHEIGIPHFQLDIAKIVAEPIDIDWMNH